jgi:hypothetical protein
MWPALSRQGGPRLIRGVSNGRASNEQTNSLGIRFQHLQRIDGTRDASPAARSPIGRPDDPSRLQMRPRPSSRFCSACGFITTNAATVLGLDRGPQ